MELKSTPLIEEHKKLNARMGEFGGWNMPIQYAGILEEHKHTRICASLFDICHMGEFVIQGDYKKTNLDKIVTMNLSNMKVGGCRYGFILNEAGGILDDLIVYRIQPEGWMIVVNAANIEKDEAHFMQNLTQGTYFRNISQKCAKLDLQGPLSLEAIKKIVPGEVEKLQFYEHGEFEFLSDKNIISRTGYTGELGFEIYVNTERVADLWQALLKDEKVKAAGLGARDTLRLEMGYCLYGQDLDDKTTPLEAGLEHFVDMKKEFIGKDVLKEQKKAGVHRKFIYFKTNSRKAPRHGYKILADEINIGEVTSGSFSPSLNCGIGMGYVVADYEKFMKTIKVDNGKNTMDVVICEKPFYKEGTFNQKGK